MVAESDKRLIAAQVLGKMQLEPEFFEVFNKNPEDAVTRVSEDIGKKLDKSEINEVKSDVEKNVPVASMTNPAMKKLFESITEMADEGYKKVNRMSYVLFIMGISLIVSTFILDVYGIIYQVNWQTLLAGSGVLGSIGIITIYESTNKLPDRVKNSVADLVQIKLSFFSFWDQLSILMGVKNNNADEAIKITEKINTATEETMKRIQTYCEKA